LLTVSAEDCWGILTAETKALHDSYTEINQHVPKGKPKGRIFISKAVILLCMAKKSRDADHLQNFVYDQQAGLDAATLTDELEQAGQYIPIPDYAYDCHTRWRPALHHHRAR
jgi:replication-associated recombination protein RarA